MSAIGFVGLGAMGSRVSGRLLDAGHELYGNDRTRSKAEPLIERGLQWCESPREVAVAADVIFSMVTDDAALYAITSGADGILAGLAERKIYVDMSTVSPRASRQVAERVGSLGAYMLDAPVSGSILTLREGKLLIMVGGDRAAFERAEPILLAIGPKVRHVGEVGQAKALKIGVNLSLAVQMLAFSEGVLLAERTGVDRRVAFDTFLHSVIASPMLQYRAPFALDPPDYAWFDCGMMQKDLDLALELGREMSVPLPTTAATREVLTATRALGYGKEDFAALFHGLARMSGIHDPPPARD